MRLHDIVFKFFRLVKDPRQQGKVRHGLPEILFLTVLGYIGGCNDMVAIAEWAKLREDLLKKYLNQLNGIPSHDTFCRILALIDPNELRQAFAKIAKALINQEKSNELKELLAEFGIRDLISLDGKSSRRSHKNEERRLHVVNVFSEVHEMVLSQAMCMHKRFELTAIMQLLEELDIRNFIVSIDALGTNKRVVKKIVEKGGFYVLPVKNNHRLLNECIQDLFEPYFCNSTIPMPPEGYHFDEDKNHGRYEKRECWVSNLVDLLDLDEEWEDVRSVAAYKVTRAVLKNGQWVETEEIRYYISNLPADAKLLLNVIRSHWGVENKLHWCMDWHFQDDQMRLRNGDGNAAFNAVMLKQTGLNIIRWFQQANLSIQERCKSIPSVRRFVSYDPTMLMEQLVA